MTPNFNRLPNVRETPLTGVVRHAAVEPVASVPAATASPGGVQSRNSTVFAFEVENDVVTGHIVQVELDSRKHTWDKPLYGCFDHKACDKSGCQCFWTHFCCTPCILPTLHTQAAVPGVDTCGGATCVCLSLSGVPDALLNSVPFLGFAQPFRCIARQNLRSGTVQKYGLDENACCTCCVSFWWCACLPQCGSCQQTHEIMARENLDFDGSCWCALGFTGARG